MTRRRRFQRLVIIVSVLSVTALTALYIGRRPVLLRDSALSVTYRVGGTRHHDGEIFRSMFSSPIRFIYLPKAPLEFQWFGYNPAYKLIGHGPLVWDGLFGWNSTHPPVVGIALNDPKLEDPDPWTIDFSTGTPSFSSRTLAVTLTPR
jgi:hypothetical protein